MKKNTSTAVSPSRPATSGRWTACVVLLAVASLASQLNAEEKSFLWRVKSDKGAIYLLGSIHYLKRENYPLKKSIQEAFENSRTLVLEIDPQPGTPERAQQVMLEKALYRDGTTLQQNVSPETYQLAEQRFRELGIDLAQMGRLKPWFVALSLTSVKLHKMGFDPNFGLDRYLADQAKNGGKAIRGLETLEFQIGLLDQFPPAEQDSLLRQTLKELDLLDKSLEQVVQSWNSGDAPALERLLMAGMRDYPDIYEKIVVDRNRRWLPDLVKMLEQGEKALVVVGAAHLVGKRGLIELLKQRGYTVEQL
jgi:uncharacterized protein